MYKHHYSSPVRSHIDNRTLLDLPGSLVSNVQMNKIKIRCVGVKLKGTYMALMSSGSCKCWTLPLAAMMLCLMSLLHIFLSTSSLKRCGFTIANSGGMMRYVIRQLIVSTYLRPWHVARICWTEREVTLRNMKHFIWKTHLERLKALAVAKDLASRGCVQSMTNNIINMYKERHTSRHGSHKKWVAHAVQLQRVSHKATFA